MHAALVCALALCWPTGSAGARDQSTRDQLEANVRQESAVVARSSHDPSATTEVGEEVRQNATVVARGSPDDAATTEVEVNENANAKQAKDQALAAWRNEGPKWREGCIDKKNNWIEWKGPQVKPIWQETVPRVLGLPAFDCVYCVGKAETEGNNNNWLTRLYWCVPIMGIPLIFSLAYYFTSKEGCNDFSALMMTWSGFFIANWIMLFVLQSVTPGRQDDEFLVVDWKPWKMRFAPTLKMFMVATCGVLFRVVAAKLKEWAKGDHVCIDSQSQEAQTDRASSDDAPERRPTVDASINLPNSDEYFKPVDIYMNPKRSMDVVLLRFTGQTFLMWYYFAHLEQASLEDLSKASCSVPRMQFICIVMVAAPCLQNALRALLGKEFFASSGLWMMLVRSRKYNFEGDQELHKMSRIEAYIRSAMAFTVDQVYQGTLLFTVHVLCFYAQYLNLVKGFFAIAIITKLAQDTDDVTKIHIVFDGSGKEAEANRQT